MPVADDPTCVAAFRLFVADAHTWTVAAPRYGSPPEPEQPGAFVVQVSDICLTPDAAANP